MKTAISVPNDVFESATRAAASLGLSRSAFFARAVQCYLRQIEAESLTREIDAALERAGQDDSSALAVAEGRRRLARDPQDW